MKYTSLLVGTVLALFGFSATAATITFNLNLSNELPDGPTYAQVTIADGADAVVAGNVDFLVEVNEAAFDLTGVTNFGMQTFAFNYDITGLTGAPTITDIDPTTWLVTNTNGSVSEFGKFEFDLAGNGSDRTSVLSFSVTGVENDTWSNYVISNSDEQLVAFATHIAGFADTPCSGDGGSCNSAFFAGGPVDRGIPEVPIPASVWLFGSGLLGLVGVARRKDDNWYRKS